MLWGYLPRKSRHFRRVPDASDSFDVFVASNFIYFELVPQLPHLSLMIVVDHFQSSIFLLQNSDHMLILMMTLMKVMLLMCLMLMLVLVDMTTDALNQDLL